jgi:hypothetical protein
MLTGSKKLMSAKSTKKFEKNETKRFVYSKTLSIFAAAK